MKRIIRKGTFETNSSSTHAIAICKDRDNIVVPSELYFGFEYHGWENETLDTPEEKANYLHTAIAELHSKKEYQEIINDIFSKLLAYDCVATFEESEWDDDDYWSYGQGSVDHVWELREFLEKILNNDNLLYRYLFSNKAFVIKGNDNDYRSVWDEANKYETDYLFWKGN